MSPLTAYALILVPPVAAALLGLFTARAGWAETSNLLAAAVSFAASIVFVTLSATEPVTALGGYLILDPLAGWVVLCVAAVYLLASIYAVGYMRTETTPARLPRFYALFAGFAASMFLAPVMNNLGLYWIAIELTTLVSTFLVGFDRSPEGTEAAWKYIIVVSTGISLALLGTLLWYWAGTFVLGRRYDMTWSLLEQAAPKTNTVLTTLAFLLVLAGYGAKVGLAPLHTWLPDAHSQGPTPVSAMLSGALLNTAMVGIIRALRIAEAAGDGRLARGGLILLGAISLLVAALLIVRQTGVKRLMAYSSVEHMGVVALGFGFGGPLGVAAALYHMLNHSLNKSLMFFGAGNAARLFGSKRMSSIRTVLRYTPAGGALWLAGAVAITGAPPFGLFLSEFTTLRAGFSGGYPIPALLMLVLLVVIFVGFLNHFRGMYFEPAPGTTPDAAVRLNGWVLAPMWLALIPLLILGLWWPNRLWHLFGLIAGTGGGS